MRLEPTDLDGVFVVHGEPVADDRGTFARTFDAARFTERGLDPTVAQASVSTNRSAGTLRGMHLQAEPFGETKLIRCTRGRVFDVAVDIRPGSATYRSWVGLDLEATSGIGLVLSPGVAHGFVTLADDSEVTYQISVPYRPEAAIGFRWDDPEVGIEWPTTPRVISDRDRHLPLLSEMTIGVR